MIINIIFTTTITIMMMILMMIPTFFFPAPLLQCERDIVGKEVFLLPSVDKINTLNRSAVMALLYR